ncbi:NnrS family protein [Thiobacter aerophilum]|uniref:NnrS family protein n=1 Tax=Thiobacter aerophilum TaxID=3121275 RepID=A0ABV0EGR7_9BURK
MSVIQISAPGARPHPFALFRLGFRPFFLLAALFSLLSILAWVGTQVYGWPLPPRLPVAPMAWHGHEMVFGYAMAVVAGFLLTAVRNWTNLPTLRGAPLAGLAAIWLAARLVMGFSPQALVLAALLDLGFGLALIMAIAHPLARTGQWRQFGIVAKIALLVTANAAFYAGALGWLEAGVPWGLYSGLYLVLSLIFVMARRVVPFFIERGVGYAVTVRNRTWVDRSSLVLMLAFWLADVFMAAPVLVACLALALFGVHTVRLVDWATPGIWRKPLLWVLYLGYGAAVMGFPLKAAAVWLGVSPYLAVHAFAAGGIGLMTVGMMARVTLGHTGRGVQTPPRAVAAVFALMVAAFLARVVAPLFWPASYAKWLALAQACWVLAFALFLVIYAPMLVRPRIDGQPG